MSQGNDAFSSKDADSKSEHPEGTSQNPGNASGDDASEAREVSKTQSASESERAHAGSKQEENSDQADQHADELADQEDAEPAKSVRGRDTKEPRNRKRGSGSRRGSRDEDEDELEPPQTEEALNVPKMQTVYMLGAMSVLTIILWFAAKLSCNIHPDQVRDPKHFSTIDLAADPKNAAFEFHHRFETGDYATALDLSTGEMRKTVEAKLKECEQDADACAKNMARLAGTIKSTGRLLDQAGNRATVELTSISQTAPGQKSYSFEVVKEGDFWRVASRRDVANPSADGPTTQASAQAAASATPEAQPQPAAPNE